MKRILICGGFILLFLAGCQATTKPITIPSVTPLHSTALPSPLATTTKKPAPDLTATDRGQATSTLPALPSPESFLLQKQCTDITTTVKAYFAKTLDTFPLYPGTSWTYLFDQYEGSSNNLTLPTNPADELHEKTLLVDTIDDVRYQPPFLFAHVKRNRKLISGDQTVQMGGSPWPGWNSFWYILKGNTVYTTNGEPDPTAMKTDQVVKEFELPFADGMKWCPAENDNSSSGEASTPDPCLPGGWRWVIEPTSISSEAGDFSKCFQLADRYTSGPVVYTVCDGVGLVDSRYDHRGTPFGYSQKLTSFSPGSQYFFSCLNK